MKKFSLFFTMLMLGFLSLNVVGQDTTNDSWISANGDVKTSEQVAIGSTTTVGGGIHLQLPRELVLRGANNFDFIGRNFNVVGGQWARIKNIDKASGIGFSKTGNIIFQTQNQINAGTWGNFWKPTMKIMNAGQVVIGTAPIVGDYKLYVESGILTERVRVATIGTAAWADYVFEEDYALNSIEEVEKFVKTNKHLPNVPSAKDVEENGIDMAEMDATLLRQVEELWLHTIELNKDKTALEAQNQTLTQQLEKLTQQVEALINQGK